MTTDPKADDDKVGEALNAQRFQMLEDIANELKGDVVFPTYFDAAMRLRKELQNPELPTKRLASIVSLEPLIATKLMNLAKSVLYSPDCTPARNLPAAISRLGFDLVRSTALAIAMNQLMRSKDMSAYCDLTAALWEHSLKTAAAARILARTHTRISPDEALLAGLVHDLGAFYMLYRAAQYSELRSRPDTMKHVIVQWHESIGTALLNALGMPEEVVEAATDHDQPRPAPNPLRTLTDVIYIANILAGPHSEWICQDTGPNTSEPENIRETYSELIPEIEADAKEMQAVFA